MTNQTSTYESHNTLFASSCYEGLMRTFERLIAMGLKGNICLLYYITTKIKISMPIVLIIFTKCYRLLRN